MDGKLSGKSDTTHNHDGRYLQKSAVINSNTVTEAGYALDARQANPNVSGSLGAQINSLNTNLVKNLVTDFHLTFIVGKGDSGWFITNSAFVGNVISITITDVGIVGGNTSFKAYYENLSYDNGGITLWHEKKSIGIKFSDVNITNLIPIGTCLYLKGTIVR